MVLREFTYSFSYNLNLKSDLGQIVAYFGKLIAALNTMTVPGKKLLGNSLTFP